jgi:predicted PurR-regulated permease PerM
MWLSILVFLVWFLYSLLPLLAPFILALVIAYIFNPLVSVLERRRIPRWASSLIIVLLLIGTVIAMFLFIMPIVVQQFNGILNGVKGITNDLAELLRSGTIFEVLASFGIPVEKSRAMISEHITPKLENVLTSLLAGVFGFVTGISSVVLQIINAVIIPFLVFYMLKDFPDIIRMFLRLAPHDQRPKMQSLGVQVDSLLGRYLRGAIAVAFLQGTIATVGLALIGVKYALVLGIMTGVLNFIPYVGLLTSLVVSSMVALFSGDPVLSKVVLVVIMYLSQKLLEASVFAPKIIGSQVGLHPVLLILCLLVFGFFLGFVGLLIAVPASALIVAGVDAWKTRRDEAIQFETPGQHT